MSGEERPLCRRFGKRTNRFVGYGCDALMGGNIVCGYWWNSADKGQNHSVAEKLSVLWQAGLKTR